MKDIFEIDKQMIYYHRSLGKSIYPNNVEK